MSAHIRPLLEEGAERHEGEVEAARAAYGREAEAKREVVAEHGQDVMQGSEAEELGDHLQDDEASRLGPGNP